jgi:aryl-alcohol dehydrogenase-like predicted oxidoreductase
VNARGAHRRAIFQELEKSLKRLQTEWIDVYFIHHFDDVTPLEETLFALDQLVKQGKILYPALSNFAAWQVMKAQGIALKESLARIAVIQPMYNLVKRQAEVELLPMAVSEGLAVIPYSPLGGGLLTGKYGLDKSKAFGRLLENKMYNVRFGEEWMFQAALEFSQLAKARGYEAAALAVAWVAGHPGVTAPIIGARNLEQLEGSLQSLEVDMTKELYDSISALTPSPALATDRSEEKIGSNWL